jgi:putative solute:sodium symporter small subunit
MASRPRRTTSLSPAGAAQRGVPDRLAASTPSPDDLRRHWARSLSLTISLLIVWFLVSFVVPYYARNLESIHFFGWPLSFYMAAQGAPIVYVLIVGIYASRMRAIDREFGLEESEEDR